MEHKDMDVLDFARKISMLTIDTPISKEFDEKYGQKENRWWSSQREHLTVWCLHYPTGGTNGYKHKPSDSARKMYYSFGKPETLLYLAESLGENVDLLESIVDQIKGLPDRTACGIVRREIPFERICELLNK